VTYKARHDNERIFRKIYSTNKWKGSESVSGPGSAVQRTTAIIRSLPAIVRAFGVRTFLDAPCGDFNWMRHVDLPVEQYIGADVVPELIEDARRYVAPGREFLVADLTADELPSVDMIFCRDGLVHMADELVMQAVANMKASGASLLFATTFYAMPKNTRGRTGGWRPINLQIEPFAFPPPILLLPERRFSPDTPNSDKSLGLWYLQELPDSLTASAES